MGGRRGSLPAEFGSRALSFPTDIWNARRQLKVLSFEHIHTVTDNKLLFVCL